MEAVKTLSKDRKHSHFWINEGELYESYTTIRGLRYRHILHVSGMPDTDKCSEEDIKQIESKYLD